MHQSRARQGPDPKGFTHGDVLEEVSQQCKDEPVTPRDASAIQAAEARATGPGQHGHSLGDAAQSAASRNVQSGAIIWTENGWVAAPGATPITLGSVLKDPKSSLLSDKVVSGSDAAGVQRAEERQSDPQEKGKFGVGVVERNTADYNYSMRDEEVRKQGTFEESGQPSNETQTYPVGIRDDDISGEQTKVAAEPPEQPELPHLPAGADYPREQHENKEERLKKCRQKAIVGV